MTTKAKSPATKNAADDQANVRSAEDPTAPDRSGAAGGDPESSNLPSEEREEQEPEPEKDSLEDIVRRVEKLEFRIF